MEGAEPLQKVCISLGEEGSWGMTGKKRLLSFRLEMQRDADSRVDGLKLERTSHIWSPLLTSATNQSRGQR